MLGRVQYRWVSNIYKLTFVWSLRLSLDSPWTNFELFRVPHLCLISFTYLEQNFQTINYFKLICLDSRKYVFIKYVFVKTIEQSAVNSDPLIRD